MKELIKIVVIIAILICVLGFAVHLRHQNAQAVPCAGKQLTNWILVDRDKGIEGHYEELRVKKIEFEGHRYLLFDSRHKFGVTHDRNCECKTKIGESK